jgi:hypothetical protein
VVWSTADPFPLPRTSSSYWDLLALLLVLGCCVGHLLYFCHFHHQCRLVLAGLQILGSPRVELANWGGNLVIWMDNHFEFGDFMSVNILWRKSQ